MGVTTGIDLIEIHRIQKSMRSTRFMAKVFSREERQLFLIKKGSPQTVACNFAAKEAFLKAFGVGLGAVPLREIAVLRETSGKPYFALEGKAAALAQNTTIELSLTHTKSYAAAVVVVEKAL